MLGCKSLTVSGSSVTPCTKRSGAPKSRAAFTNVFYQPRPTIAVLSMQARLRCRRRAGCLADGRADASFLAQVSAIRLTVGYGARSIALKEIRLPPDCQADLRNGYLLALSIIAGVLLGLQILFDTR
jgi:hypothetical protein